MARVKHRAGASGIVNASEKQLKLGQGKLVRRHAMSRDPLCVCVCVAHGANPYMVRAGGREG